MAIYVNDSVKKCIAPDSAVPSKDGVVYVDAFWHLCGGIKKMQEYTDETAEELRTEFTEADKEIRSIAEAAQSTADNAAAAASNAQSTADSATSAASEAQSTADSAVTAASEAQSTAEAAQSTADSAVTAASNAQSTADSAATTASEAQSAAEEALKAVEDIDLTPYMMSEEVKNVVLVSELPSSPVTTTLYLIPEE